MYAVIESGGKQYKVAIGDRLKVESLDLDPGASVDLESVLFLADGDDIKVGSPYVGSTVKATVVGHGRGEKIRIFKMRRRKNSRQRTGHRQNFTELEIVSIDGKSQDQVPAEPVAEPTPVQEEPQDLSADAQVDSGVVEADAADSTAGAADSAVEAGENTDEKTS